MVAGLLVKNDSNTVQLDQDYGNFVFKQKITLPDPPGSIVVTNATAPLLVIGYGSAVLVRAIAVSGTTWTFTLDSNSFGNVYIFDKPTSIPQNLGLAIYKADGSLGFHSSYKPLKVHAINDLGPWPSGKIYGLVNMTAPTRVTWYEYESDIPGENWLEVYSTDMAWIGNEPPAAINFATIDGFEIPFQSFIHATRGSDVVPPTVKFMVIDITDVA